MEDFGKDLANLQSRLTNMQTKCSYCATVMDTNIGTDTSHYRYYVCKSYQNYVHWHFIKYCTLYKCFVCLAASWNSCIHFFNCVILKRALPYNSKEDVYIKLVHTYRSSAAWDVEEGFTSWRRYVRGTGWTEAGKLHSASLYWIGKLFYVMYYLKCFSSLQIRICYMQVCTL